MQQKRLCHQQMKGQQKQFLSSKTPCPFLSSSRSNLLHRQSFSFTFFLFLFQMFIAVQHFLLFSCQVARKRFNTILNNGLKYGRELIKSKITSHAVYCCQNIIFLLDIYLKGFQQSFSTVSMQHYQHHEKGIEYH